MDWIERLFGVSPDNGDGTLEMAIGFAVSAAAIILVLALNPAMRRALLRRLSRLLGNDEHTPTG